MHRKVIDEPLIIECIREARQSELDAKDDENNNSSYRNTSNNSSSKNNNSAVVNVEDAFGGDSNFGHKRNERQLKNQISEDDEPIDFTKITELSLSFRDIYKIDHLRGFENVVQLRLDNNLIERIENLDHMVNLQWLDLSFNNISKIEGLEDLTKLTDLCLVNNFITKIENLEHNKQLQVLSLGNNCIEAATDYDNMLYLRQFEHLQALNLKGNPIVGEMDFKVSVFAYCQNLKFLDYERIKENDITNAKEELAAELAEIEANERGIKKQMKQEADEEILNELLCSANIDGVSSMFEDMMREDSEMIRLQHLPGFEDEIIKYSDECQRYTQKYLDTVVAVYKEKLREDEILRRTLKKVSFESESYSIDIINKRQNDELPQLTEKVLKLNDAKEIEGLVRKTLQTISDALMQSEMECVEKINFIINAYEDRIMELMKQNLNNAETYFAEIQNLENEYHQKLLDLIASILERIKQNGIDSVIQALPENESIRNMIMNKEAINNSIALSHENHISHIGRLEDTVRDREEKEKKQKMENQNNTQYKRNRQRISEILIFVEKYAKQFNVKMS